jgi:hypothetical protein
MEKRIAKRLPDFRMEDNRSLVLLWPVTSEAEAWERENIAADAPRLPGNLLAIEPRMFPAIAEAILSEGLTMQDAITGRFAAIMEG